MGLFDVFKKKTCDLCGNEIGLLGNRKLEDGNCCKDCAGKLSRWFDERRHSTVEQIRAQLAYRAENEIAVGAFHATKVIGQENLVYFDEKSRRFFVSRSSDYQSENPDILNFEQVLSCSLEIDDRKTELMREVQDKEGNTKRVSYTPRRYLYKYDFYMKILVDHPYFDEMHFRLNDYTLELETSGASYGGLFGAGVGSVDPTRDIQYRSFVSMGEEIVQILKSTAEAETKESPVAAEPEKPEKPTVCPWCSAPVSGGKFCTNCGGNLD